MARISEEQKNDAVYYLNKQNMDLRFSKACLSRDDVDVIKLCVGIIEISRLSYLKAKDEAPHNIKENIKTQTRFREDNNVSRESEAYLNDFYPCNSWVKDVKNDVLGVCKKILKENGFGKKRIEKIIPFLTEILKDSDAEFADLDEFMKDFGYLMETPSEK